MKRKMCACVLARRNDEKQPLQVFLNNSEKQSLQRVLIKTVKVSKSTGDNNAEELFQ